MSRRILFLPLALALLAGPGSATAADSTDACTGFVDSVPATITSSGRWCLRRHLATAAASGAAITVTAHHVTLDCNGFMLRGVAPRDVTTTSGVVAINRFNTTVRGCHIAGFQTGVHLTGSGHAVLDSAFVQNTAIGIAIDSSPGVVRGNRVADTAAASPTPAPRGISAYGDVDIIDNTVDRVFGEDATRLTIGILSFGGQSNVVEDNRVMRVRNALAGGDVAIRVGMGNASSWTAVRRNVLSAVGPRRDSTGVLCMSARNRVEENTIVGFPRAWNPVCRQRNNRTFRWTR